MIRNVFKNFFFKEIFIYSAVLGSACRIFDLCCDMQGTPQGLSSEESACSAGRSGDTGSIPGSGRSPGGGHGNPPHHSSLESPVDRGAWWATVHRIAESDTTEATLHACM